MKKLISFDEVDNLSPKEVKKLYSSHVNTGMPSFLGMLGFDRYLPLTSEDMV